MVKENSRKDSGLKTIKEFLSTGEIQELRGSVSADVLYNDKYRFLRNAIDSLKIASATAEYRQILHAANAKHFPEEIQGKMPELVTEDGTIVVPFIMEQVGGRFNRATVIIYTANQNTFHGFKKVVENDPSKMLVIVHKNLVRTRRYW